MTRLESRASWAQALRDVAHGLKVTADALDRDDDILGAIAGIGLGNSLPALPKHIRDVLMEHLSDEAAASLRADTLYMEQYG